MYYFYEVKINTKTNLEQQNIKLTKSNRTFSVVSKDQFLSELSLNESL